MSTRALIALILCNVVWSANPTAGKIIIREAGTETAAWLRYGSALAFFVVAMRVLRRKHPWAGSIWLRNGGRRDWLMAALIGLSTCFLSPVFQMLGLTASTAMGGAILVAMEPIITVMLGWIFLREKLRMSHLASFAFAIAGFFLLSGIPGESPGAGLTWKGNFLLLLGVSCDALYSVIARPLLARHKDTAVFGSAMSIGVLACTLFYLALFKGLPRLDALSARGWLAVFWFGPLGTAITFLIWLRILTGPVPLGSMVLTLFLQPFLGSLFGALFLGESLQPIQFLGGGVILLAVIFQLLADTQTGAQESIAPSAGLGGREA